jgi:hypothetical protein
MKPRQGITLSLLFFLALGLTACGGGPGVRGPEAQTLFSNYSGVWALDSIASETIPMPRERTERGPGSGDPFGTGGGRSQPPGGGAGLPGGGMGGRGGFGGRGGAANTPGGGGRNQAAMEAMRATVELATRRPDRITLALDDSLFTITESPGGHAALPMHGDEVEIGRSNWRTLARVAWDDRRPRYERSVENGGKIVDRFELVSRNRLKLTRKFNAGPMGETEVAFFYDRVASR